MEFIITRKDKLLGLLKKRRWRLFKKEIEKLDAIKIVEIFNDIEAENRLIAFRLLNNKQKNEVFKQLTRDDQLELIKGLSENPKRVSKFLETVEPDDRTAFLEDLPQKIARKFINFLSSEQQIVANQLLAYPKESIGRLMTTEFLAIKSDLTVKEAFEHIREFGRNSETLNVIYIVDEDFKLIDDITIKDLILADLDENVTNLIDHRFISLNANDDQEAAIQVFKDYDRLALPVIGEESELLGIVTFDDIMDVAERESSEDFHKFGAVNELDFPYVKTSLLKLTEKRASWLVILFLGEMLTATAMGFFEAEIEKAVVLALFVPLVISSGGNSGSQAATLIIRALALKEITIKDWWFVMRREIASGFFLGLILGIIGLIRITVWQQLGWYDYGDHWLLMGITICVSLIGIVLWGTLAGALIPLILKRLKMDPATSSAPFVATLVDVTGLIIYFSIAALILSGTIL